MLGYTSISVSTYRNPGIWKDGKSVLRIYMDFDNHEWKYYLTSGNNAEHTIKHGMKLINFLNGVLHAKT